jgi:hypothetical protein
VGWPELPYAAWSDTKDTLHMEVQIMGKVRSTLSPKQEDWGHAPFYLTARGLNTSPIPYADWAFDIDVDLIDHVVSVRASGGKVERLALEPRAVADFLAEFMALLGRLGIEVEISPEPSDVSDGIAFAEDRVHSSYDPAWASRFFQTLVQVDRVLKEHRASFAGKATPVQLWWGSLDLAYSRFTPDGVEHAAGFWPGDAKHPEAAFYAYASPRPDDIAAAAVEPAAAAWSDELGEFLLPYEAVATATDPRHELLAFLGSTYHAGLD